MTVHDNIDAHDVLEFVLEAGSILLKNGAEIWRVEETMDHICAHYDIHTVDTFVLSNGIFITAEKNEVEIYAKVKHIPLSGIHLGIVAEVNDLSREICAGHISLLDAAIKLEEIEKIPPKRDYFRVLAAGLGSACFSYLLQGTFWSCVMTFFIGALLYIFVIFTGRHKLSKVLVNIGGGALITILAIIAASMPFPFPISRNEMIIGSIMPLIPGVSFTNAIRDVANSDILSGTVRLIDSLLLFVYIATGVGFVLSVYNGMIGGMM